jgi:hypothetical protein
MPTWLATAGSLASAWYQVHKAPQTIQCLQPLLSKRWMLPQMAAVQQRREDAVRGNFTNCHGRLCSFQRLFSSGGCMHKKHSAAGRKGAASAVSANTVQQTCVLHHDEEGLRLSLHGSNRGGCCCSIADDCALTAHNDGFCQLRKTSDPSNHTHLSIWLLPGLGLLAGTLAAAHALHGTALRTGAADQGFGACCLVGHAACTLPARLWMHAATTQLGLHRRAVSAAQTTLGSVAGTVNACRHQTHAPLP